jgi:hypothetical protein
MAKALSNPIRQAFYSRNIVEATSQYDIGLIEDCLKASGHLNRLRRLTLLAELSAIRTEDRHIHGVFKSLRLYRDDLNSAKSLPPFHIEFRLSVVDFHAKMQRGQHFVREVHGERTEQPAEMASYALQHRIITLTFAASERDLHFQHLA